MYRLVLSLALFASGCSLAGPSDADIEAARSPEADGVIVNRTSADILVTAFGSEGGIAIDLVFVEGAIIEDRSLIIQSGDAAALDIGLYEAGDDFVVYVTRVRGDRTAYTRSVTVDGEQFERDGYVLNLNRF